MKHERLKQNYPFYLANEAKSPNQDLEVTDKYSGKVVTRVAMAGVDTIESAIAAATDAAKPMARLAPYERKAILEHCVRRFEERAEELATVLRIEAGKPIKDSRGEVTRLIETFQIAAHEAVRDPQGEVLNLELGERTKGYRGMFKRVPIGPCSFISPFNFPLNLTAHKVAPAIAAGCPFVLKPASRTPLGALIIGEVLAETELPEGAFSILPCKREGADLFTEDERLKLLSFTGSPDVGWKLKSKAGKKKVILELGGNAVCIVDDGADLEDAVSRVVTGAFYQSGQSCISVQRILVHESVADAFTKKLVAETEKLKAGDPADEDVFVGPIISKSEAERIEEWIRRAKEAGGKILCGGGRKDAVVEPTLMSGVPKDQPLQSEEVFGPVAVIDRFSHFDEALEMANDSRYGIHTGVFTPRIDHAMKAWDELEVGGVLINEMPSWRVDNLPYGGVKDSGLGREGPRYAIEDMTEIRSLVIRSN
ncbi:aldehyde dehydrogenase family protein [Pelagicoccus enzymogenes]|uniref:aldehyde dehydrogenase family protein n=1 Tax=Pelagicoccus enzymogenes TaxID=2773457 RepID=UPI00281002DF|nr:aldehyde dehydrogenase family protein [Pelagicoccus enzymogenes]MDQ8199607.1 aldehyde dehydrogenase family protein [Pelagicoccus enzymogenes]